MVAGHRIDDACVRGGVAPAVLALRLSGLGGVHGLLSWIHGFLVFRYLSHPLCQREVRDPAFRSIWERRGAWAPYLGAARVGEGAPAEGLRRGG
jgi:hypothetical protein